MAATTALGQRDEESWLTFTPDRDIWHADAPQRIRLNYQSSDDDAGWQAWQKHLCRRRHPRLLRKILPGGDRSLLLTSFEADLSRASNRVEMLCSLGKISASDLHGVAMSWLEEEPKIDSPPEEILE